MSHLTRRQFLNRSALAAVTVSGPWLAPSRVLGANDEIRIAVIGCGVRGAGSHVPEFSRIKGVKVVAVCDPDRTRADGTAKGIKAKYGNECDAVYDVRKLMERKDLDVISVATMQYWHALPTIWACQTGRHVYVEKPLSHFIWEGRQMVNAARKYNRIVQVGTQNRSNRGYEDLGKWLKEGGLGKIQYVTCCANKPRKSIGKRSEPLPIPETLDYELWCGPARKEPIFRDRIQYDCSFTWNMGDGESCNQGVHEIDIARWILGYKTLPRRTMSIGGRFVFNDAGDVPNTQILFYDYADVPILYEIHNLPRDKSCMTPQKWNTLPDIRGMRTGVCVQCEGGYTLGTTAYDKDGKKIKSFSRGENHFQNFINAVRSGKREELNADVEEGHLSTIITHAGNVSYRLGKPASAAEQRKQIGETPCMVEMHERLMKYLKGIEVDPDTAILGPWLECDVKKECFKGDAKANEIAKGWYRSPFTLDEVKV
ncbi:MAG: Glycosyl hydrolase family 109 protein 1 precursor [Planctomycetes bacterium ADurb.Bin126]|nr:MAG: Glycosyl hydrolase family 109 protein 1 precursor [Planctomycetes bacterium ADurb.Bin126]HOD83764.1 Gfo/Idh/MocA family oxidoreductase [Phycisphaerae bacterium]HQL72981.1 Gfo/Idh/MocA family oxidoreductase [Phycisphaerae bacterium]